MPSILFVQVSGLASAFVDNIPLTTMMVRVTAALARGPLALPLPPLAWALSFGACLGGKFIFVPVIMEQHLPIKILIDL